ncbi:MAG TPA: hypothetical protein PKD55_02275 [Bellilinea sp.]|nr:hypothetical protein [Bellilinea sp.]
MDLALHIPAEELSLRLEDILPPDEARSEQLASAARTAYEAVISAIDAQAWVRFLAPPQVLPPAVLHSMHGADSYAAVLYTLGSRVDTTIAVQDPLTAYYAHQLASQASFAAFARVEQYLAAWHVPAGGGLSTPRFPGEAGWPLKQGLRIFHPFPAGVQVNAEGCLTPLYSGAALIGIGTFQDQQTACELCERQAICTFSSVKP